MISLEDKVKDNERYVSLLQKMYEKDRDRLINTKAFVEKYSSIKCFSTFKSTTYFFKPFFEPKVAFFNPLSYFQNIFINDEKLSNGFSHGSTTSVFFEKATLFVISKFVTSHNGKEFFSHYLFAHFDPSEYDFKIAEKTVEIRVNKEKNVINLLNNKEEKINISFNFIQENLENKIIKKEEALLSTKFVSLLKSRGIDAKKWLASTDYMFSYTCTVHHFSPHPYLFHILDSLPYTTQEEFQLNVIEYFKNYYQIYLQENKK